MIDRKVRRSKAASTFSRVPMVQILPKLLCMTVFCGSFFKNHPQSTIVHPNGWKSPPSLPPPGIPPAELLQEWSEGAAARWGRWGRVQGLEFTKHTTRVERSRPRDTEASEKLCRCCICCCFSVNGSSAQVRLEGLDLWPLGHSILSTCGLIWVRSSGCCWYLLRIASPGCACGSLSPDSLLRPRMAGSCGPAGSLRWRREGCGNGLEHRETTAIPLLIIRFLVSSSTRNVHSLHRTWSRRIPPLLWSNV